MAEDELWYDCDTFIGTTAGINGVGAYQIGPKDLKMALRKVGVGRGLVTHVLAKEHSPVIGNQELVETIPADDSQLYRCWVGLPTWTKELPPPSQWVNQLNKQRVRAVRIFPSFDVHRYVLAEWTIGPLLAELEASHIPLFIDFNLFRRAEPDWRGLYDILTHHPDLDVVLLQIRPRNNRTLFALIDHFPRLYIESGGFAVHAGIEWVCENFGANRLVFGSGFPYMPMGAARLQLERAEISDEMRQAIAFRNLEAIFRQRQWSTERGIASHE